MTRFADSNLKTDSGIYKSQIASNRRYELTKTENIRVRVPIGTKDLIVNYQKQKHKDDPENPKYSSLNALIIFLLEVELGQKLK